MPEMVKILVPAILGALIAAAGIALGFLAGRRSVKPALRAYDPHGVGEETVEVRTAAPESVEVAVELESEPDEVPKDFGTGYWPVKQTQRLDLLDGETVRIRVPGARVEGAPVIEEPYAWLRRHGNPDRDRLKLTRTQEQRKLDGVSG